MCVAVDQVKEAELPKPLEVQKIMNEFQMSDIELRDLGLCCGSLDLLEAKLFLCPGSSLFSKKVFN